MVLDRIRSLAAPLVLSSRRLDPPAAPSQTVPPGAFWEVIVAKHPEQSLIEKNRALVNHLGFRQVAHALVRTLAAPGVIDGVRKILTTAVSGAFASSTATVPQKLKLVTGTTSHDIDLTGGNTLDKLVAKIEALGVGVTAAITPPIGATIPFVRLVLTTGSASAPLRLLTTDTPAGTDLVTQLLDLSPDRFELPVNSLPKTDPKQLALWPKRRPRVRR